MQDTFFNSHLPEQKPEIIDDITIVKVGTSSLIDVEPSGALRRNHDVLNLIGEQLKSIGNAALVSSGAIGYGMIEKSIKEQDRPSEDEMPKLQALSTYGARILLHNWALATIGKTNGQVLVTNRDFNTQGDNERALSTIHQQLIDGSLPIINENDPISYREIEFGDNDILAATLASRMKQSGALFGPNIKLVMLTNVDGVHDGKEVVNEIDGNIEDYYDLVQVDESSVLSSGGLESKLDAAKLATGNGVEVWIANSNEEDSIARAINGEIGTYFPSPKAALLNRQ